MDDGGRLCTLTEHVKAIVLPFFTNISGDPQIFARASAIFKFILQNFKVNLSKPPPQTEFAVAPYYTRFSLSVLIVCDYVLRQ